MTNHITPADARLRQDGMPVARIHRRPAIRSGEESVVCSTALLRRGIISADFPRARQAAA